MNADCSDADSGWPSPKSARLMSVYSCWAVPTKRLACGDSTRGRAGSPALPLPVLVSSAAGEDARVLSLLLPPVDALGLLSRLRRPSIAHSGNRVVGQRRAGEELDFKRLETSPMFRSCQPSIAIERACCAGDTALVIATASHTGRNRVSLA